MIRTKCPECGCRDRVQRTIEGRRVRICAECAPPSRQGQRDVLGDDAWLAVQVAIDSALGVA